MLILEQLLSSSPITPNIRVATSWPSQALASQEKVPLDAISHSFWSASS
jgi:hypothetical protein